MQTSEAKHAVQSAKKPAKGRSKKIPTDMVQGAVHKTNSNGELVVVDYFNAHEVKVRFIETGYCTEASSGSVRKGAVKDRFFPSVHGVGFIGCGEYAAYIGGNRTPQYLSWSAMIQRCYDDKYHKLFPAYKDCEVCEEWQDFQKFAAWYDETHPGYDVQLDKDGIIQGNKVYSPETCQWVTAQANSEISLAKKYLLISPDGNVEEVFNLSKFCRENGLNKGNVWSVLSGRSLSCKGWTKA